MTFTRTASGLRNYSRFYNAEVVVYIEGKVIDSSSLGTNEDEKIFDLIFYTALFKTLSPYKNVKIKIVGCKDNVLDYHDKIVDEGIDNSYVVIDRDYDGFFFSRTKVDKLIVTHGYSWENDFWSHKLIIELIEMISLNAELGKSIVINKLNRSISRLCLVNRANIIAKYSGISLFPIGKALGTKGFKYNVSLLFPLPLSEIQRILLKIPEFIKGDINSLCLVDATKVSYRNLIQGHFYEYMILQILCYAYKLSSGVSHNINDFNIIKNLAFNNFKMKPDYFLEEETLKHYEVQFDRLFK